jgi:hypothetical protein
MIYEALLVPSEIPTTLREIKRALLTYDKVILVDPSDRELFPRNAFLTAVMGFPAFGMDTGPVRPMGKAIGYDERFERTLDYCQDAVSQDLIKVISTYDAPNVGSITIGGVPLGGYPLDPSTVYQLYRGLASSQDFLSASLRGDTENLRAQLVSTDGLAMAGIADGSLNDGPSLPIAEIVAQSDSAEQLTQIARSRLGALVKYMGFCESKNVIPVLGTLAYRNVLSLLLSRTKIFIAAGDQDGSYLRRSRVLDLAHEEFLVDERLDKLTVNEVIKLRTSAWGKQAIARERLFQSVFEIAESKLPDSTFLDQAAEQIREYRKVSETLIRERESLKMAIKCDLGKGSLLSGVALVGLVSQIESPIQSVGLTLAAGGVWALDRAKEYVPKFAEMHARTTNLKRGAGFAIHDFYSRLPDVA